MKNRNLFFGIICLLTMQFSNLYAQNLTVEGNAGIGTTTPQAKLDVRANAPQDAAMRVQNENAAGYSAIDFRKSDGTYAMGIGWANNTFQALNNAAYIGTGPGDPLLFLSNNDVEAMRLQDGKLGIGTENPQALLDVNGNFRIRNLMDIDHKETAAFSQMADVDLGTNGILIENRSSESAGFHADHNSVTIWSVLKKSASLNNIETKQLDLLFMLSGCLGIRG